MKRICSSDLLRGWCLQPGRRDVRVADRRRRGADHVFRGLRTDVRQVAHDADPVHLGDRLAAEIGEAAVVRLVASRADQVLRVVGHLHDADAQLLEEPDVAELVLEGGDVLEPQHDGRPSLALGPPDVLGRVSLEQQVVVLVDPRLPPGDIRHRPGKILPDAAGAVGAGQTARPHVLEDATLPVRDDQPVKDDHLVVEFVPSHRSAPPFVFPAILASGSVIYILPGFPAVAPC